MRSLALNPEERFKNCDQLCSIIFNELNSRTVNDEGKQSNHFSFNKKQSIREILIAKLASQVDSFCSKLMKEKVLTKALYSEMKTAFSEYSKTDIRFATEVAELLDFFTMSGTIEATNYEDIIQALKKLITE
ncbi:MAG: hypothetical protein EBT92_12955 [Planctomycetes bacterium]|nr:hypothetical protein [Planctomycetota bacterium]